MSQSASVVHAVVVALRTRGAISSRRRANTHRCLMLLLQAASDAVTMLYLSLFKSKPTREIFNFVMVHGRNPIVRPVLHAGGFFFGLESWNTARAEQY